MIHALLGLTQSHSCLDTGGKTITSDGVEVRQVQGTNLFQHEHVKPSRRRDVSI
jgi:hypothetical protein